jgi:RNA polymerase sigma factor (sigma-70 family)
MQKENDEYIPTRRSLLSRLRNWDDQESWRDFFDTYGRFIYRIARKTGLSDAEAQDVVQDTLVAVAKQMPGFQYNPAIGSFKGWLHQVTRRRVVDHFRRRHPDAAAEDSENFRKDLEQYPDPAGSAAFEMLWEQEWQWHLLHTAKQRVKRRTSPKQFQLFDLYVVKRWPIKTIMSTLGVSAPQIYMAKLRISKMIRAEIKHLQDNQKAVPF